MSAPLTKTYFIFNEIPETLSRVSETLLEIQTFWLLIQQNKPATTNKCRNQSLYIQIQFYSLSKSQLL